MISFKNWALNHAKKIEHVRLNSPKQVAFRDKHQLDVGQPWVGSYEDGMKLMSQDFKRKYNRTIDHKRSRGQEIDRSLFTALVSIGRGAPHAVEAFARAKRNPEYAAIIKAMKKDAPEVLKHANTLSLGGKHYLAIWYRSVMQHG